MGLRYLGGDFWRWYLVRGDINTEKRETEKMKDPVRDERALSRARKM